MATSAKSSYQKYETRTRSPNPKTSVLLVIDVQNFFSTIAKPILPKLLTTIDLCRRASVPVIFTRHVYDPSSDNKVYDEWWNGEKILDGTPEAELLPEIKSCAGENEVMDKNTYVCCETTARDAFTRGFRVFFSTDATASWDLEMHEATLKNMAFGFAYLVDCDRLENGFSKALNFNK